MCQALLQGTQCVDEVSSYQELHNSMSGRLVVNLCQYTQYEDLDFSALPLLCMTTGDLEKVWCKVPWKPSQGSLIQAFPLECPLYKLHFLGLQQTPFALQVLLRPVKQRRGCICWESGGGWYWSYLIHYSILSSAVSVPVAHYFLTWTCPKLT